MNHRFGDSNDKIILNRSIEIAIRIGLIALLVIWSLQIVAPFLAPIVWGIIIAIGIYPVFHWIHDKSGMSNGLAATLFTLLMLVILITPTVMLTDALLANVSSISATLEKQGLSIPPPRESVGDWPLIGKQVEQFWNEAHADPEGTLRRIEPHIKRLTRFLLNAAAGAGVSLLLFVFSIIISGVFLAKAKDCAEAADKLLIRLAGDRGKEMVKLSHATVISVIQGVLGIALIQALLAGVGFLAMGIPGAGILALICLILAVVQIDILIILIPLSIYAFSFASVGAAIAFLIWNIAVGLMNNFLKPILLSRGVDSPMAVIFIGAIGGMLAFGIIGLFVGAVVLVISWTLFTAWLENPTESAHDDVSTHINDNQE